MNRATLNQYGTNYSYYVSEEKEILTEKKNRAISLVVNKLLDSSMDLVHVSVFCTVSVTNSLLNKLLTRFWLIRMLSKYNREHGPLKHS